MDSMVNYLIFQHKSDLRDGDYIFMTRLKDVTEKSPKDSLKLRIQTACATLNWEYLGQDEKGNHKIWANPERVKSTVVVKDHGLQYLDGAQMECTVSLDDYLTGEIICYCDRKWAEIIRNGIQQWIDGKKEQSK